MDPSLPSGGIGSGSTEASIAVAGVARGAEILECAEDRVERHRSAADRENPAAGPDQQRFVTGLPYFASVGAPDRLLDRLPGQDRHEGKGDEVDDTVQQRELR